MKTALLLSSLLGLLGASACSDETEETQLDAALLGRIPLTHQLTGDGLRYKTHLIRDRHGIAHIYARTSDDASYAQGFLVAHDRLPQMDLLRRFADGTISELYGAIDPRVIDTDLTMRVHRLRPVAEESWNLMRASSDAADKATVRMLQRYSDGVNAYAQQLAAGNWDVDPQIRAVWEPLLFRPWTPVDSLVLGRFQAFSLAFTVENELILSEMYQRLMTVYAAPGQPGPIADRRGIARDMMRIAPVGNVPTIEGFPNYPNDTGTRADAGRPRRRDRGDAAAAVASPAPSATSAQRPTVPTELFAAARSMFPRSFHTGALGTIGPQAFMAPRAGSNNWAVAPWRTGGKTLLGTDQHLQLSNPSIFYPVHLNIEGDTEVLGVSFPGIPGIILGTNGDVAWSGTVAYHDVNDVYLEQVAPCGAGSCVSFKGQQVPIETWNETIKIGALGQIVDEKTVTYERVPHHGPVLPTIANGAIVPRAGNTALSIKFTGYQPSFEIRAVYDLMRARNIDQAFTSLKRFSFGGQNWTMIDNSGNIGWTSNVVIPTRSPNATTWNAATNPLGNAPFLVLPGDGSAEWEGTMSSRYVPHAINPLSGYLATANSDPTGATFDDDPLNQPVVDGRPLYAGFDYAAGLRLERIADLLEGAWAGGRRVTLADFAKIQHDTTSTVGSKLTQSLVDALAFAGNPAGAPADVAAYLATLTPAQKTQLGNARTLLSQWTRKTPPAVAANATAAEIKDSSATSLFNTWMHFFIAQTLDDELSLVGFDRTLLGDNRLVRIVYGLLEEPAMMAQSASSGQPILCDRVSVTGPDDSCTKIQLTAMVAALEHLASPAGYGSSDPNAWRWGLKHRSTMLSVLPNPGLDLPNASDGAANAGGFPKAGDTFVINRADAGWNDLSFAQSSDGAAQRFLAEAERGRKIKVKWQIPGGTIFDSRSPHYRDLLDKYYLPEKHFDAPFDILDVLFSGEERWTFDRK